MKTKILLIIGCLMLMQAKSQTSKILVLADQYFAAGDYFTAAGLYGQYLNPVVKAQYQSTFPLNVKRNATGSSGRYKNKTDILFRQAESYRLANYWKEACTLYKECLIEDPAKFAAALYWIAVGQRSLGDYKGAEESIHRFLNNYSKANEWYNATLTEQQRLEFIKMQLSRPDTVLYHMQKMRTGFEEKGTYAPVAINNNEYLFTSTQTDSVAAGKNPNHNRLFTSMVANNGLQNRVPLVFESLDSTSNQGAGSVSPDGNHLYFTQWKKVNGQTVSSIYLSNKTNKGWSKPELLPSVNQQGHNSKQPFCSSDGKYLYFASDRTGGKGGFDIWYAPLQVDGTTGEAINVNAINTSANEQAPFYHISSATLVFASDRMPGMGGYDLFFAKGSEKEWGAPENMGYPVNSARDDIYFFTGEKGALLNSAIISSDRGSECCLLTYAISKEPKKKMISGVVMDCANNEPLDSAEVILKDADGKTWQTITTADGKYKFELHDTANQHLLEVSKEKYNSISADLAIQSIDETNWRTDTLQNAILCLEKKPVLKIENVVTVYFDFDKSNLDSRGVEQMDSIYNVMLENPSYTIQVSGYTDGKGSAAYNQKLSDKRAKSCAEYLIQKGLDPTRISYESFGASFPVEMELINGRDNAAGRSKNRRALINIKKE